MGNVSQVVWSAASFVSLIRHSTGWEDNSKFMNGPIEPASDVLVCYLPGLFSLFYFLFFVFVFLAISRTVALITALIFHV